MKILRTLFLFCTFLIICVAVAVSGYLYLAIVVDPGDDIKPEKIRSILGRESDVFYSDGTTKLGVYFDSAHRQYVDFKDIPQNFVNALVASEDERFFSHFGFDIFGISRAIIRNIQAGRVVQGGSTLTQQTAKNLYKRTERSYEAKLKELLFALRLEYRYPKEQIFEFYANQFYVSGNGHGLGVAARYHFDKTPDELTLIQCAFIAGSVKRPNYYNSFIKKNVESKELALKRAKIRVKYVLGKMLQLGMITVFEYNEALEADFGFNKGKVGFARDYAMDLVTEAVSSTEVLDALAKHNIDNIATSGVRVITTIDKDVQAKVLPIVRRELSRLDVRLRGYEREEVQAEVAALSYTGDSVLQENAFLFGTIEKIEGKNKDIRLQVTLDKNLGNGVILKDGLSDVVTSWVKWRDNRWSEVGKKDLDRFVTRLMPGDRVWVRVDEINDEGEILLHLEKYPKVQGGALVLQNGFIKAMTGGSENRFFNRATQANRAMGSAFKPFVFTAALQLGWNTADLLRNSRDVFVYHGQPYFPRPDHKSDQEWVSMSWAGVRSENVASVWLLSRLCEQMTFPQFREVAKKLGLAPQVIDGQEEPYRSYRARIRDRYGIRVNRDILRASAYKVAIDNMETDFIFDGMIDEYKEFKKLHYGLNFRKFSLDIDKEFALKGRKLKNYEKNELLLRKKILKNTYLRLKNVREKLASLKAKYEAEVRDPFALPGDPGILANSAGGKISFGFDGMTDSGRLISEEELFSYLASLTLSETSAFWQSLKLNNTFSVAAFDKLSAQIAYEYEKLTTALPYDFEVLSTVEDFRITVGLYYCISLAEKLGISSQLDPVLSFTLGSNVVTLLETTRMYEALVTGKMTTIGISKEEETTDSLAIIGRIESTEGELLYEPTVEQEVVIDSKANLAIGHVLENIVKFGTGRLANTRVTLESAVEKEARRFSDLNLSVPLLGKTGTANRYTNASFFGYLPGIADENDGMQLGDGYAVGVYVGFDDNSSMRKKSSRITGSSGALPAWCDIVNVLLEEKGLADRLDPVDLSFYGLVLKRESQGQINARVDVELGGKITEPVSTVSEMDRQTPSILTFGSRTDAGAFRPDRTFHPFWYGAGGRIN